MEKYFNMKEVKWILLGLAVVITPFWLPVWPVSAAIALMAAHALAAGVQLHPVKLLGALMAGLTVMALHWLQMALPRLDHPEALLLVPFLFAVNVSVGAFIPRIKRLLRSGRLLGWGLVWLSLYLFAPTPGISLATARELGWFGWLLLLVGAVGIVVGDYHRPLQGLRDLRQDSYWHGERLTDQEAAALAGGREGERAVQSALAKLNNKRYTAYHGIHLRSGDPSLPKSQEFDHVVVGPNGVFSLETKNWRGKVLIKPSGEWQRAKADGTWQPWESPVQQIERHRRVLRSVLHGLYVPIVDCLVMTNSSTEITGREHCPLRIIPVQQLLQVITDWQPEQSLSPELCAEVNRRIQQSIIPAGEAEAHTRSVWRLWHWLAIDALASVIFFWLLA